MAAFFPKTIDRYIKILGVVLSVGAVLGVAGFTYFTLADVHKDRLHP